MARTPRITTDKAAKAVADKYIPSKGKTKPKAKDKAPPAEKKSRGRAPPEIRILQVREPDPKISDKEALFIELYACDPECRFNGAAAARRAGYPEKSARQVAYELLTKPYILRAVEIAKREQLARVQIDSDHLLLNLVADMRADIADLFAEDGSLKAPADWPLPFRTGLVAGIEVDEIWAGSGDSRVQIGITKKVKLADRTAIKRLVGQHATIQAFNPKRKDDSKASTPLQELARQLNGTGLKPKDIEATARAVPSGT